MIQSERAREKIEQQEEVAEVQEPEEHWNRIPAAVREELGIGSESVRRGWVRLSWMASTSGENQ